MVDNTGYKTSFHAAREIFNLEGIRGFYHGYCSCILTDCINSGFQVLFYDTMRRRYVRRKRNEGSQVNVTQYSFFNPSFSKKSALQPRPQCCLL